MTKYVRAYIEIKDVPEWQIGEKVTVHFKDTMCIWGICKEIPQVDISEIISRYNLTKKRCLRCGRILKDPIAQERGYGEICWKKHLADNQTTLF